MVISMTRVYIHLVNIVTKMEIATLARQNPWWSDPARIGDDFVLATMASQPIRWTPRLLRRFQFGRDRVYTLRGPRQVGKTTSIKQIIRRLIESDSVDPRSVLYFSCDLLRGAEDLDDLVETYLRWQAPFRLPRRHLFLDEVSSVRDWSIGIRGLANRGRLRDASVVLTGSHALDVTRQVERLPGRRGESAEADSDDLLDKVLLPMKFAEYAETVRPEVRSRLEALRMLESRRRAEVVEAVYAGRPTEAWSALQLLADDLKPLLADYLLTGGFPRPLNDLRKAGRIPAETYDLYVRALTGDLARWGHDERTARELLAGVVEKLGTPVSWRALADETDVGSHNTVAKYVGDLERTFTLQTVYQIDRRRGRPAPKKERKVYVADPFLFHAVRAWALGLGDAFEAAREFLSDPARRGLLLEAVVADHLARLAFAMKPRSVFDAYEHVMFWRNRKGWEVDFVLRGDGRPKAFQVTATRPRGETFRALTSFGGGLVLTEGGEGESVPLPVFLLLF